MINTKEYNEILEIFKEIINNNEITITPESFTINNIKHILLTNSKFQNSLNTLKDNSNI
jgi:phage FluMu gp28-like protein